MKDLLFEPLEGFPPLSIFKLSPLGILKTGSWRSTVRPAYCKKDAPCHQGCPAGEDIPAYFNLVKQGKIKEAWDLIRQDNPLPATCGRVCFHPCEKQCNRGQFDEPISINAIERCVGDFGLGLSTKPDKVEATRGKVAVVGSGPAGLSCAYHLAKRGYAVTIFESSSKVGGMLALGIPEYRLPRNVLQAEIALIEQLGVTIVTGVKVGSEKTLDSLFEEGYKAVFLAIGAHKASDSKIAGLDTAGVIDAVSFLRQVNSGEKVSLGHRVAVVGGGNSAIDAARCAKRLGAKEVSIIYRRSRAEMPAHSTEVEAAEAEGIQIQCLVSPVKAVRKGSDTGIECLKTKLGEPDASGRRAPVPEAGTEFTILADTIILATGQMPDSTSFTKEGIEINKNGTFGIAQDTLATSRAGVFAGGDAVTGPARVVDAIAAGKKAAQSIDLYISKEAAPAQEDNHKVVAYSDLNLDYFQPASRVKTKQLPADTRTQGFQEVGLPLSANDALVEIERCFSCGHCNACDNCWVYCPDMSISRENQVYTINYDYCKGCGVCVTECPRSAIDLVEETK